MASLKNTEEFSAVPGAGVSQQGRGGGMGVGEESQKSTEECSAVPGRGEPARPGSGGGEESQPARVALARQQEDSWARGRT